MPLKRLSFRTRVFLLLVLFAAVPSTVLMLGGAAAVGNLLPLISSSGAWERTAASGQRAIAAMRASPLTARQRAVVDAHEQELAASLIQARRFSYLSSRAVVVVAVLALIGSMLFALLASRAAGHLSRQLSRPINELVGWTERIARGEPLPADQPRRGAPEFALLRGRMREMATAMDAARERELEAERQAAFRETARRVAHELKNPLTPIRFAVERLRREVKPELAEVVEVLATESRRLEEMAREFAQFGKLPEGPAAEVDVGELVRYTARATVPEPTHLSLHVDEGLPMVRGHYAALARALSNVMLNAVEACKDGGGVEVHVGRAHHDGQDAVELRVRDTGCGIPPGSLGQIWEPYVTTKPTGTGLGLAIVRQTVLAHRGSVSATSAEGRGTEIRLVLPIDGAVAPG